MSEIRTFKYVDKDKLIPAITKRIYQLMEDSEHSQGSCIFAAEELRSLLDMVEAGFFDWQQGSE